MTNQEAIEVLSEIRSDYNFFDKNEEIEYRALSMAIEALKAQLSTDDTTFDTTFGKWISCSERLPEMDGKYLITEVDGCVTCDYFRLENGDWRITFPIAWMPLPSPYKENES